MIETRVIIVDQLHTVRKKRGKRFITRAIVKLAALFINSGKTMHKA